MTTDKKSIALLADIFVAKGFRNIVISPGSRNAPVILAFTQHPEIKALSIVDERSAAFFALGIARQTGKTVALSCTSGTAALNYAPAIAEALLSKSSVADPHCRQTSGNG
jgi:2-succinyl-5-enolpyruvyl-6-hydroxy-3-cyclohexene-1-carboxylate synthase